LFKICKNIRHFTRRPKYLDAFDSVTKHLAARRQCQGNLLLRCHGNAVLFFVVDSHMLVNITNGRNINMSMTIMAIANMPHCYVISTLPVLFRVRFEVVMIMTMKTVDSWYATNVARLINTDAASDHSAFVMCLSSTHNIRPRKLTLNNSSRQNQKLQQIVISHLFGPSWSRRCFIYK